jgi:hypothetical protein
VRRPWGTRGAAAGPDGLAVKRQGRLRRLTPLLAAGADATRAARGRELGAALFDFHSFRLAAPTVDDDGQPLDAEVRRRAWVVGWRRAVGVRGELLPSTDLASPRLTSPALR